jgi:hypothetical protein
LIRAFLHDRLGLLRHRWLRHWRDDRGLVWWGCSCGAEVSTDGWSLSRPLQVPDARGEHMGPML